MKKLLFILLNYKLYKYYHKKRKGKLLVDWHRGAGYYIMLNFCSGLYGDKHKTQEIEMNSGKKAIYNLIEYKTFDDPSDMVEWSKWNFAGYKGVKLIRDCVTFYEFVNIYGGDGFKVNFISLI